MFGIVLLALFVLVVLAALFGRTHDSRDTDYSLGEVIRPRRAAAR